jgi:hypothetical protein
MAAGVAVAVLVDVMAADAGGHQKYRACIHMPTTTSPTMMSHVRSVMTPP